MSQSMSHNRALFSFIKTIFNNYDKSIDSLFEIFILVAYVNLNRNILSIFKSCNNYEIYHHSIFSI